MHQAAATVPRAAHARLHEAAGAIGVATEIGGFDGVHHSLLYSLR